MAIDVNSFLAAADAHERQWGLCDRTLYELCRTYPTHQDIAAVNAKLLFIGRVFASGVERNIRSANTQGSSLSTLAIHLNVNRVTLDGIV
jgi:hypothetical protein